MIVGSKSQKDFSINTIRVHDLLTLIKAQYPAINKGTVLFFADLEHGRSAFVQESSFFYYTGITEPGAVATFDISGTATLYVPAHGHERAKWVHSEIALTQENAKNLGFTHVMPLGQEVAGYQLFPYSDQKYYETVIAKLKELIAQNGTIFTLMPQSTSEYIQQRFLLSRLEQRLPNLSKHCIDISPLVASMRRKKDMREIEELYKAVEITILAHGAAADSITAGVSECEVQAGIEYMFTAAGARPAFPSIVASGKNATILHYTKNCDLLQDGQLVVVDIGAEFNHYCADITRTYPVSGTFTKRQRELYNLVLETQEYIADIAKPGMWLSNKEKPQQSLHHLAKQFLDQRGYGKYFIHGIGHFLGLDVHDVGNIQEPLQEGDVFTLEPGIYIPEEKIGIRIEDNYWMVKDSVVCLSESLPKRPEDIEAIMQEQESADIDEDTDADDFDVESDEEFDLAQS